MNRKAATDLCEELARLRTLRERRALDILKADLPKLPQWQQAHVTPLAQMLKDEPKTERRFTRILAVLHYLKRLPPERQNAIESLTRTFGVMQRLGKDRAASPPDNTGPDPRVREIRRGIFRALEAGLQDHPVLSEWVQTRRLLGARDELRAAKRKLELGSRRPQVAKRVELFAATMRLLEKGLSLQSAYENLCKDPEVKYHNSYEALRRLMHRRGGWKDAMRRAKEKRQA